MLALAAAGLGSCPQASLSGYPSIIRSALRLEGEPGTLLLGMSFGYPDDDDPTALARPPRSPPPDVVRFPSACTPLHPCRPTLPTRVSPPRVTPCPLSSLPLSFSSHIS